MQQYCGNTLNISAFRRTLGTDVACATYGVHFFLDLLETCEISYQRNL